MPKRKPTICQACGYPSYAGRVCRACKQFYGGDADNCVAAANLARLLAGMTYDQLLDWIAGTNTIDFVVPDWPGPNLQRLLYSNTSARQIGAADKGVPDATK